MASETVTINIATFDTTEIYHEGKTAVTGQDRIDAKAKLTYMLAARFHQEQAGEVLDYSRMEPAYRPKPGTLRKMREEGK